MFRREQRSGDAQGGTADDGPGVVSQVVSQVVKNAPARGGGLSVCLSVCLF